MLGLQDWLLGSYRNPADLKKDHRKLWESAGFNLFELELVWRPQETDDPSSLQARNWPQAPSRSPES